MSDPSLHSLCRWTFHEGTGRFVPSGVRPDWAPDHFDTVDFVRLVQDETVPRLPDHVELGVELHYDNEYDEENATDIADALDATDLSLAMVTPGAHLHHAYGGIASLDPDERAEAQDFCERCLEVAYGPLRPGWSDDPGKAPSLVIWNGSFGYDLATPELRRMYQNLKESLAKLCRFEAEQGGELFVTLEPKPNEGHPAMLLPTVASAIVMWYRIAEEFDVPLSRKGVNKEIGHSEMVGLDPVHDTIEELDNGMMHHTHLNSQGYNDGISMGGSGRFDIDQATRINGMNIAMARLMQDAGFDRWKGHDVQARPYDDTDQALGRVLRSVLSWEACEHAAAKLDGEALHAHLASRDTAKAEDLMRGAVATAQSWFDDHFEPVA
ncbi:sugar phosphate isomerase/epimerase family protein [Salinibacter grassmerensis]|uniref:sugar phosphate isomerase/epimerase family protein n=1 Tax=Salinibacter grassmerensis TaxID=3040353 RepID=UPI0021E6DB61|nr:TIM barrel protein [Salinibacter grassmerensis]